MSADLCKISVYIGDVPEPVQWLIIPEVDIPPIALFHSMIRTFAPMRPAITAAAIHRRSEVLSRFHDMSAYLFISPFYLTDIFIAMNIYSLVNVSYILSIFF